MDYATVAEVKTYGGVGGPKDDKVIEGLITRASKKFDTFCKHPLVTDTDTTRYFTVGRDTEGMALWFDGVIASITQVLNGDPSTTEVTSSEYALINRNNPPYYGIRILRSAAKVWEYTTDPEDAIAVTGKWAWHTSATVAAVPADIKKACVRYVAFLYRQRDTSQDVDRPILTDAGVTLLPSRMPQDVIDDILPYRMDE